jgi:hypothetical protein
MVAVAADQTGPVEADDRQLLQGDVGMNWSATLQKRRIDRDDGPHLQASPPKSRHTNSNPRQ